MSPQPAKLSRTEIAQRVRATIADRVVCPVEFCPESAILRGTGEPGSFGFDETDVLHVIGAVERSLGCDLFEVRALAFEPGATVGSLIDQIEGAVHGGIRE